MMAVMSPLETFLGGMETAQLCPAAHLPHGALKPSLVEWKLFNPPNNFRSGVLLETFLGGMETSTDIDENRPVVMP